MHLEKKLAKHIKNEHFVKVYTATDEHSLENYTGFIFEENEKYILMSDMTDFNEDGFVILKKEDINRIRYRENERYFLRIMKKEKLKKKIFKQRKKLKFKLDSLENMMKNLQTLKIPIICEHLYKKDDFFQIGIIKKVLKKKSKMRYFNAIGEWDLKLLPIPYKSLTVIRIDSPYQKISYKYMK